MAGTLQITPWSFCLPVQSERLHLTRRGRILGSVSQMEELPNKAGRNVALTVLHNLQYQHDWTSLELKDNVGDSRPLIVGLPPKRLYVHPDEQIQVLADEQAAGERLSLAPEFEWVLAVHIDEKWSMAKFAAVFDSNTLTGSHGKRLLLATVHNDSTIVYYVMHAGMVKPRQN